MVLLHMKTDNLANTTLAKFDSLYNDSYIQYSNANNYLVISGISGNSFKIYNPNNSVDDGFSYNDNILSVRTTNTQIISYNNYTIFPNLFTNIFLYEITEYNTANTNPVRNCFDMNSSTTWISPAIYYPYNPVDQQMIGTVPNISEFNIYKFQDSLGYWIKIRFPYQIIPVGVFFNSIGLNFYDPSNFVVYVSNDNINWKKVLTLTSTLFGNEIIFDNTDLYLYVAIVITKIKINPNIGIDNYQSFSINQIKIYSSPVLHIDNNVKICNNNIYNVKSINTKQLILNNNVINSANDLNTAITNDVLASIVNIYNIYWKNNGTTGYFNSNIINRLAINSSNANATLDINGDINFKQRALRTSFSLTNKGGSMNIPSSYVYIGKLEYTNSTTNYFKLTLVLFELDKYYFQIINIYGYTYNTNNINIYWDTSYDNSYTIQRITGIHYLIDTSITNKTAIKFYCKYNNLLRINISISITNTIDEFVNNITYIDLLNTNGMDNNQFIVRNNTDIITNTDNDTYLTAYLISENILNRNGNVINNLNTSNITFASSGFTSSNFLITDNNRNIIDSGISSNSLAIIAKLPNSVNRILGTNNNGILSYLNVSANLLSNIDYNTSITGRILITSNNLFESISINKTNFSNLNLLNTTSNSIVIINSNNELKTTNTIPIQNLNNVLSLFNFNINPNYISINSNLNINTIYIGNSHTITSNFKFNRLLVNNREIADDIFKIIIRIPNYNDNLLNISFLGLSPNDTNSFRYSFTFNSGSIIFVEVNVTDSGFTGNSGTQTQNSPNNIHYIFNKSKTLNWNSQNNFGDYNVTNANFNNIVARKQIYNDIDNITICGSYIIFEFQENFILNFYVLYLNFSNIVNAIKDFKLVGYDNSLNKWVLIDQQNNINPINNLIPNVFRLNKPNFNYYSKYAICILNTYNTNSGNPAFVTISGIEFFGYPLGMNYYSSTSRRINYNYENNINFFGSSNVGINNIDPYATLSIGNDLPTNPTTSLLNLNHNIPTNNIESPIIVITRPSINNNTIGIKATHYLNSLNESNTRYTIKLTHQNINNEKTILSMNSTGNVAIGGFPSDNLSSTNSLSLYNNNSSKYINLYAENLDSNYSFIFPPNQGYPNLGLIISNIVGNNVYFKFDDPISNLFTRPFIKIGDQSLPTRAECNMTLQIAGKCIIASNVNELTYINRDFLSNTLIVAGRIYTTRDISSDSDISYKYNIKIIDDPLVKINKINGYTFNRNDTDDNNRYTGLIAQEVIKVMPEVITTKHDGKLRIIYTNLAGLFVESIKKLDNKTNYINFKLNIIIGFFGFTSLYLFLRNK